ncbi:5209_t:CDS:10, partial [Diversispora eburnea]
NERSSDNVNKFWITVDEELINSKIKHEENEYDLTLTTNVKSVWQRITDESNLNDTGTPDENNSDKSYHPNIKKSALSEGAKKWVIDTFDVSSLLLEYRDMSVQKAFENKIEEIASENFGNCKPLLRKWQKDLDDDQDDIILEIFKSMEGLKEDSFVHEVFEPLLLNYFRSTDVLEASAHRKHKFDPSLYGRKADFSIYVPVKGFQCQLFAMDLKYEAVYWMILLGKFYLPKNNSDLGVLSASVERLMQMKVSSPEELT